MRWYIAAAILSFACATGASAEPSVAVSVGDEDETVQAASEPLLIYVGVCDRDFINRNTENRARKDFYDRLSKSEAFVRMPPAERKRVQKMYELERAKILTAGSAREPLARRISFSVFDGKGNAVAWPVRPLKISADMKGGLALDGSRNVGLFFGVDATSLAVQPRGVYTLRASMDRASSDPVTVELKDIPLNEQDIAQVCRSGRYHILNGEFDGALARSEELIRRDGRSVEGWALKGDALDGLGRKDEALAAYENAFRYSQEAVKAKLATLSPEDQEKVVACPPIRIMNRIRELSDGRPGPPRK